MSETEIYFCGSIRAGRDDVDLYAKIVDKLAAFGKVSFPGKTFGSVLITYYFVALESEKENKRINPNGTRITFLCACVENLRLSRNNNLFFKIHVFRNKLNLDGKISDVTYVCLGLDSVRGRQKLDRGGFGACRRR
jgi:hypothetical protein